MDLENMVEKISNESGLEGKEIKAKIEEKREELGGLITPEGAAHIIANEVGVNLFEGASKASDLKIENIIPGMHSVNIVGKVLKVYPLKEFDKKDGSKGTLASLILGDDTGSIRVLFWGSETSLLNEGKIKEEDILRIEDGYSRETQNGEAEVHIGSRSSVSVNPSDVEKGDIATPMHIPAPIPQEVQKKISELEEGMSSVGVLCKVVRIHEVREFERNDKSRGKVVNLSIADKTGRTRLVLWGEDVELVEAGKIKKGTTIRVNKGYVKARYGEPELNIGKYGELILDPDGEVDVDIPDLLIQKTLLGELENGDKAEIRGALMELYSPTVFDRKSGKGMVVNALIDDGTACMRAAFYDKLAERLLNIPLKELDAEGDVDISRLDERRKEILGKEITATVNVKHSDFSDKNELVVLDLDFNPDPREVVKELLKEAKAREE